MPDLRDYAHAAARRVGIDTLQFERQIDQESGFNPDAHNDASGADGIAQIVVRWHPEMAGKTRDPEASLDYAAGLMASHLAARGGDCALALSNYNAGPGATSQGLDGTLDGWPYQETVNYVASILQISQAEAARRLTGAAAVPADRVVYDPDEPTVIQGDDWSCAPTSTRWALSALGRNPAESWMESTMIASGIVSTDDGLLDGSGKRLAAWITEQYGEFGYSAQNAASVSFDDVRSVAGASPVLLGGHGWGSAGHWTGVRRYDPSSDTLLLANPGGTGPVYGQQSLSRSQFSALGPFSMVRLTHPDLTAAVPDPTDPRDGQIVALTARVAQLETEKGQLVSTLGFLTGDVARALEAATETLKRHAPAA